MTTRSILITGCSTGIGYTCALGMQERGWRVLATVRNADDEARLSALGLEVLRLDYSDPKSIAKCADDALKLTNGKIDALFNNGAYGQPGAVEDLPVAILREQFEANFFGWHDLTCRLLPAMRANGGGRIVNCSSVLGLVAFRWRGAYNASKFALEALSDTLRLELRGSGIFVCQIEPGPIRTHFRKTAIAKLQANIEWQTSHHAAEYTRQLDDYKDTKQPQPESPSQARLETGGFSLIPRYKLGPEAVLDALIHALESRNPKPKYYVTFATKFMSFARRVLPNRLLDILVHKQT